MAAGGGSSSALMAAGGGSSSALVRAQPMAAAAAGGGGGAMTAGGGSAMAAGSRTFAATASAAHTAQEEEFMQILAKIETMSTFVLNDDQIAKVITFSSHYHSGEHMDKIRAHLTAITEWNGYEERYSELITMLKDGPFDSNRVQKKFLAVINAAEKEAAKAAAAAKPSKEFKIPDYALLKNEGDKQVYVYGEKPVWPYKPSECNYEKRTGKKCPKMGCCWMAPDGKRFYLTHNGEKRPGSEPNKRCWWAGEDGMQCFTDCCYQGAHFGRSNRETAIWVGCPPATGPASGGAGGGYYDEE
jgi:hypothetical protein